MLAINMHAFYLIAIAMYTSYNYLFIDVAFLQLVDTKFHWQCLAIATYLIILITAIVICHDDQSTYKSMSPSQSTSQSTSSIVS